MYNTFIFSSNRCHFERRIVVGVNFDAQAASRVLRSQSVFKSFRVRRFALAQSKQLLLHRVHKHAHKVARAHIDVDKVCESQITQKM